MLRRVLLAGGTAVALAYGSPASADAFTERFVAAIKRADPKAEVQIISDNEVSYRIGESPRTAFLDNVRRLCANDAANCDRALDDFIRSMTRVTSAADEKPRPDQLRVIYRHREFVSGSASLMRDLDAKERAAGKVPSAPIEDSFVVARPWVGEIVQVIVVDFPQSTRPLNAAQLRDLGISSDVAFNEALRHTDREVAEIEPLPLRGSGRTFAVAGTYYASSYLNAEAWRRLAEKARATTALACLGAAELVVFSFEPEHEAAPGLQRICTAITRREPKPISSRMLRWTAAEGWRERP